VHTAPISTRCCEALQWAAELHRHQRREGTTVPYFSHLIAVSSSAPRQSLGETALQAVKGILALLAFVGFSPGAETPRSVRWPTSRDGWIAL